MRISPRGAVRPTRAIQRWAYRKISQIFTVLGRVRPFQPVYSRGRLKKLDLRPGARPVHSSPEGQARLTPVLGGTLFNAGGHGGTQFNAGGHGDS